MFKLSRVLPLLVIPALLAGGCGPIRPDPPPQPPPIQTQAFAVVTKDFVQPSVAVSGVLVQCASSQNPNLVLKGTTNDDGYLAWNEVRSMVVYDCTLKKDGYVDNSSSHYLTPTDATLTVPLEKVKPAIVPPWTGRLHVGPNGVGYVDDAGVYQLPLLKHFGEAFSRYVRDPEQIRAQLRVVKDAGYDGIRFWDTLGYYDVVWRNKEVMPWRFYNSSGQWVEATPDYYGQQERFLTDLKNLMLTTHHSRGDLNSSNLPQVLNHTNIVAQIYDRLGWDLMALGEGNNEDWQNGAFGPDRLRQIVAPFAARGAITALSSGQDAEEPATLRAYATNIFYVHGARGPGYPLILRHIFSIAREGGSNGIPKTGWQGEPAGPGSGVSVGRVNDREMLGLMAGQSFISRQAWVEMSGCGVFYTCPLESEMGFWGVPRVRDAMEAFGRDMMTWRLTHRSASDAALRSNAALEAGDERVDQAIAPDGRVAATVYGNTGRQSVQNVTQRSLSCDIIRITEDETLARETVIIPPSGWAELTYRVGRTLLCTPTQ